MGKLLEFTPLEFETENEVCYSDCSDKLEFTPLEFETKSTFIAIL